MQRHRPLAGLLRGGAGATPQGHGSARGRPPPAAWSHLGRRCRRQRKPCGGETPRAAALLVREPQRVSRGRPPPPRGLSGGLPRPLAGPTTSTTKKIGRRLSGCSWPRRRTTRMTCGTGPLPRLPCSEGARTSPTTTSPITTSDRLLRRPRRPGRTLGRLPLPRPRRPRRRPWVPLLPNVLQDRQLAPRRPERHRQARRQPPLRQRPRHPCPPSRQSLLQSQR